MNIDMKLLKNTIDDIKSDDSWVKDNSHSRTEFKGVRLGLNLLVHRLEEKMTEK